VLSAAALTGCFTTAEVGYRGSYTTAAPGADVYVSTPDLVTVSPGIQVVADYDEPVFYTDGFYWRFYNNGWYRSNNYATGWYYYERPPVAVLRIDRPYAYVRYRPQGYVVRNNRARYRPPETIVRDHRSQPAYRAEPVVRDRRVQPAAPPPAYRPDTVTRDHRQAAPAARPAPAAPAPVVRDHRKAPPEKEKEVVRDHRR
jgi:hypothetical protein